MTYRIVRTRRKGRDLTRAETLVNRLDAPTKADALTRFRELHPYWRHVPLEDLEVVE